MAADTQILYRQDLPEDDEYRIRRIILGGRHLLSLMFHKRIYDGCLQLNELDIPEGAKVVGITSSPLPGSLNLYISHPSFDPVPFGVEVPIIEATMKIVLLKHVPSTEGKCPTCLQDVVMPDYDCYEVVEEISDKKE